MTKSYNSRLQVNVKAQSKLWATLLIIAISPVPPAIMPSFLHSRISGSALALALIDIRPGERKIEETGAGWMEGDILFPSRTTHWPGDWQRQQYRIIDDPQLHSTTWEVSIYPTAILWQAAVDDNSDVWQCTEQHRHVVYIMRVNKQHSTANLSPPQQNWQSTSLPWPR